MKTKQWLGSIVAGFSIVAFSATACPLQHSAATEGSSKVSINKAETKKGMKKAESSNAKRKLRAEITKAQNGQPNAPTNPSAAAR